MKFPSPVLHALLLVPLVAGAQEERAVLGRAEVARWEFERGADGWTPIQDAAAAEASPGVLALRSTGIDPAIVSPPLSLDASANGHVLRVRMNTTTGGDAQLFWSTAGANGFDESRSVRFPIASDGAFHEYEVDLRGHPRWRDTVNALRLDTGVAAGRVAIDWIAVEEIRLHPFSLGPGVQEDTGDGVVVRHLIKNHMPDNRVVRLRVSPSEKLRTEGVPDEVEVPARGQAEVVYKLRPPGEGTFSADLEAASDARVLRRRVVIRHPPSSLPVVRPADREQWGAVAKGRSLGVLLPRPQDPPTALLYLVDDRHRSTYRGELEFAARTVSGTSSDHATTRTGVARWENAYHSPPYGRVTCPITAPDGAETGQWEWTLDGRSNAWTVKGAFTASRPLSLRLSEGIVLRLPGRDLDQGLFSGLEFLGKNESSSSTLDIETAEHWRVVPDPLRVTVPLMGVVKNGVAVGLAWPLEPGTKPDARILQPSFSVPNAVDGEPNLRMSLSLPAVGPGRKENRWEAEAPIALKAGDALSMSATLYILPGADVGGLIEAWLKEHPLPPLPPPPRDDAAEWRLCAKAYLDSAFWDAEKKGWGHCVEPNWPRAPHADHLGYLWKLGLMRGDRVGGPEGPPRQVREGAEARRVKEVLAAHPEAAHAPGGGAHVRTRLMPFTLGDPARCLAADKAHVDGLIAQQRPDGLWTYEGKYRRGHFEDTAGGYCAHKALLILDYAKTSLDAKAREAGLKALAAMNRFRTPRGAQTWELSLHTPDILASAYLVGAYVRGYELTKDPAMLARAKTWALTGVPFVYLWDRADLPVMRYATIPVYGASDWHGVNWMGLPVQWCGLVYAHRLLGLARHDPSVDWRRIAEGITVAAEQMQNPDGPAVGGLPDSFSLSAQRRNGPMINPGAIVANRLMLRGDRADAETDLVEWGGRTVAVTTVARDVKAEPDAPQGLTVRGRFHPGAAYYWVFAGCPAPSEVRVNGEAATKVDAWPAEGSAWRQDGGWVIVRVGRAGQSDDVRLR